MTEKLKKFVQSNRGKFDTYTPSNKIWDKIALAFQKDKVQKMKVEKPLNHKGDN